MKFTTFTQNLLHALIVAERSSGKSLQLPIVNYVLFDIEKNKLSVSGTNLEQGVTTIILGKSDGEGKIAVPARMAGEFIRSIKSERITIAIEGTLLKIETESNRASLQGLSGHDFPVIPKITEKFLFDVKPSSLARALESVVVAASGSDMRSELQGVFFSWNPREGETPFVIVATDSFRLAEFRVLGRDLEQKEKETMRSCIVPLRAAQELMRIADETQSMLSVSLNETQVGVRWEDGEFVSRLIEGSFPNYLAIIPSVFKTEITCARKSLIELIRQAGLFASKINDIKVNVDPKQRRILLASRDTAKGEYDGQIECAVSGQGVEITFNYQFLLDGLERIRTDEVFIGISDPSTPVLLRSSDSAALYCYVVMPLRV